MKKTTTVCVAVLRTVVGINVVFVPLTRSSVLVTVMSCVVVLCFETVATIVVEMLPIAVPSSPFVVPLLPAVPLDDKVPLESAPLGRICELPALEIRASSKSFLSRDASTNIKLVPSRRSLAQFMVTLAFETKT